MDSNRVLMKWRSSKLHQSYSIRSGSPSLVCNSDVKIQFIEWKIIDPFIKSKVGSNFYLMSFFIIIFNAPCCIRSKAKQYSFSRVDMKFSAFSLTYRTKRTYPHLISKGSKSNEDFSLTSDHRYSRFILPRESKVFVICRYSLNA